nr:apolipoprotein A1/A4/E domain protein [uncultured bacterium]
MVATAAVARLFLLTQPALMQIGWFAYSYDTVMPWKQALTERVHASWAWRMGRLAKERAKRNLGAQWHRMRPAMLELRASLAVRAQDLRTAAARVARDLRQRWVAFRSSP